MNSYILEDGEGEEILPLGNEKRRYHLPNTFAKHEEVFEAQSEERAAAEISLLGKIDWHILPLISVMYFLSYLDRINLGNVHDEIIAALGLHEWQFSMAVSIFFVSYVTLEIPSNLILRRVPSNLWLGGLVLAFGLISTATIFAKEFWQLLLIRLALGAAEAGLFPGLVFYLTQYWYNQSEYSSRIAYFFVTAALAGGVGGLLAFIILRFEWGLEGWQWLFVIEGVPSILVGAFAMMRLPTTPDSPRTTWLTEEEKDIAIERCRNVERPSSSPETPDTTTLPSSSSTFQDTVGVLTRPLLWGFALVYLLIVIPLYSIGYYLPTICKELGYDDLYANLLTLPCYLFAAVIILLVAHISDKTGSPAGCVTILSSVFAVMYSLVALGSYESVSTLSFFAIAFANSCIMASVPPFLAWLSTSFSKRSSERAVATAFVISVGNIGGIIGPNLYGLTVRDNEDGEEWFVVGHLAMAVDGILFTLSCLILWSIASR